MDDNDLLLENSNFTLSSEVSGPALAVTVGIEFILSLASNLFVLIFTLCHPKTLKQPSIIFLTNFVLVNLMVTVMVMPFTIITAFVGEWVFGSSVEGKYAFCQFTGFVFEAGLKLVLLTLTAISIDRFLFIVKPLVHKRYMKPWVAAVTVVIMWVQAALVNIPPFFNLGEYGFIPSAGNCIKVWGGHSNYVGYFSFIFPIALVLIIVITSLWTFCFTRKFIRNRTANDSGSQAIGTSVADETADDDSITKHIYTNKMRKLIGIFELMIVFFTISFTPFIILALAGTAFGMDRISDLDPVFPAVFVSLNANFIANPIIQLYFRKDLKEFIVCLCSKIKGMLHPTVLKN